MDYFAGWFPTWLLVLVIDGDLQDREEFDSHTLCMQIGSGMVEDALTPNTQYFEIEGTLDGFFCEEIEPKKPEKVTQVTPKCLAPTRQCS